MRDCRAGVGAFAMLLLLSAATHAQPLQQIPQVTQQPAACPPVAAIVCGVVAGEKQS